MTFQHTGHGCLGVGGILGGVGIHLPEHKGPTLQERINEHHERVTQHVNEARDHVNNHINDVREHIENHFGGGGGGGGESVGGGAPLDLIFGNPAQADGPGLSLAAIPVGGGVTVSIVAMIAILCMALIMISTLSKTVAVRCSR
jgi:hypothetical protein